MASIGVSACRSDLSTLRLPRSALVDTQSDGSRGGQVHRPCLIRGAECATRLSLSFGRITCTPAENSFVQARNP